MTPSENAFLELLERYETLLPDHEHIGTSEDDRRVLFSTLAWLSYTQLRDIQCELYKVISDFTKIVDKAIDGEVRQVWLYDFKDIIVDFESFCKIIDESVRMRIH